MLDETVRVRLFLFLSGVLTLVVPCSSIERRLFFILDDLETDITQSSASLRNRHREP